MPDREETIDGLDRRIIKVLQRNGRTPNTDIGRELGVTEATVRHRISRLLGEGLINVVAVPTPKAVGRMLSAIIGISVQLRSLHDITATLITYTETRYVGLSTGRYDIIVEAFFEDQEHLLDFITNRVGQLEGVVNLETSLILQVAKFSYEWEIS